MILSLLRFGIAPAEPTHAFERNWAVYRKENGLDLYGKAPQPIPVGAVCCAGYSPITEPDCCFPGK